MNETIKTMLTRRSVRAYKDTMPAEEDIKLIIEAARFAPTGMGSQDTMLVIVKDKAVKQRLSELNSAVMGGKGDPFYGAPVVITVFADRTRMTHIEDGALAMGNMLNAAHSLGLASCWIHRAREVFESEEGRAMAHAWGVPDSYIGIGNMAVGYAAGDEPLPKPRKESFTITVDEK